jgi:hypothetical protein
LSVFFENTREVNQAAERCVLDKELAIQDINDAWEMANMTIDEGGELTSEQVRWQTSSKQWWHAFCKVYSSICVRRWHDFCGGEDYQLMQEGFTNLFEPLWKAGCNLVKRTIAKHIEALASHARTNLGNESTISSESADLNSKQEIISTVIEKYTEKQQKLVNSIIIRLDESKISSTVQNMRLKDDQWIENQREIAAAPAKIIKNMGCGILALIVGLILTFVLATDYIWYGLMLVGMVYIFLGITKIINLIYLNKKLKQ